MDAREDGGGDVGQAVLARDGFEIRDPVGGRELIVYVKARVIVALIHCKIPVQNIKFWILPRTPVEGVVTALLAVAFLKANEFRALPPAHHRCVICCLSCLDE